MDKLWYIHTGVSGSVVSKSLWSRGLQPPRLLCPWDSPGKNTGLGSGSLLQGIFATQGSNLGLLHCRQFLYCLSHYEIHIHTIEHYRIMKMNEIQLHVTIQMNLPQYWMKETQHKRTHPEWVHLHKTQKHAKKKIYTVRRLDSGYLYEGKTWWKRAQGCTWVLVTSMMNRLIKLQSDFHSPIPPFIFPAFR